MSMNVCCYLMQGSISEEIHLVQTPTSESYYIVYSNTAKGLKRPWRDSCRLYLQWVNRIWSDPQLKHLVKTQRKLIGDAWRRAEETGNMLRFEVY